MRNQYAPVMPPGGDMLTAEPGEVTDVLGEQRVPAIGRSGEDVGIRPAYQPQLRHRDRLDALIPKHLSMLARVHLVEEKLHRESATAVS